jgi:predicted transposase/invertase (TIGR01784 family)
MEVAYLKFEELMKESRQDGIEYGIEIGEKRGEQRGIELGRNEGIEIGEQRGIGTVAAKMKAKGLPIEIIKETTGLDDAAIEKL